MGVVFPSDLPPVSLCFLSGLLLQTLHGNLSDILPLDLGLLVQSASLSLMPIVSLCIFIVSSPYSLPSVSLTQDFEWVAGFWQIFRYLANGVLMSGASISNIMDLLVDFVVFRLHPGESITK